MSNIFWSNIFKKQSSELQNIADLWQSTPLFNNIPARHIEYLSGQMHVGNSRRYPRDTSDCDNQNYLQQFVR